MLSVILIAPGRVCRSVFCRLESVTDFLQNSTSAKLSKRCPLSKPPLSSLSVLSVTSRLPVDCVPSPLSGHHTYQTNLSVGFTRTGTGPRRRRSLATPRRTRKITTSHLSASSSAFANTVPLSVCLRTPRSAKLASRKRRHTLWRSRLMVAQLPTRSHMPRVCLRSPWRCQAFSSKMR